MKWGAIGFLGFVALFCVLAGVHRIGRLDEAVIYFAIAAALVLLALRTWRYYRQPNLALEAGTLVRRAFWRLIQRWPVDQIAALKVTNRVIRRSGGKTLPIPVFIEELEIEMRGGRVSKFVLPRFTGENARLLSALSQRSGAPLQEVQEGT